MLASLAKIAMHCSVSFPGGKQHVFRRIVNLMPPHRLYVESHLGGGAVLRGKRPAHLNIGIDCDVRVIDGFRHFPGNYRFVCDDAITALERIDVGADALVYCDPPYPISSRRSSRSPYRHDLTEAAHKHLLSYLRRLPCAVMISSYINELYCHALADWNCVTFSNPSRVGARQEVVWMNFASPTLLHDTRFLGNTFREREVFRRRRRRWHAQFGRLSLSEQQAILGDLAKTFEEGIAPAQRALWESLLQPE